jgi:hypothetical protein
MPEPIPAPPRDRASASRRRYNVHNQPLRWRVELRICIHGGRGPPGRTRGPEELQAVSNSLQLASPRRECSPPERVVIDKLCLRVPHNTPFTSEFQKLYAELRGSGAAFRPSKHYDLVGDLRPFGYQAVLHLYCRRDKAGALKIELVECGRMSFDRMHREICAIFKVDPGRLPVMRLDLAADVQGVPVNWFRARVCVRYKRSTAGFIVSDMREIGKGSAQTLYYGQRPNTFRIYDKVAEQKKRYSLLVRQASGEPMPSFEEFSGFPETGFILTRVEREMGGANLSGCMVFSHLRKAVHYRPFDALQIIAGGIDVPNPDDYTFETYGTGMFLRNLMETEGMQAAIRHCRRFSKGNTSRILEKYRDFLPADTERITLDSAYLNQLYQQSVWNQLTGERIREANSGGSDVYLSPTYEEAEQIVASGAGILPGTGQDRRATAGEGTQCRGAQ